MQRQWPPFAWVCFSMCTGVMGTALASPLYPLYQERWHLAASDIAQIYVVYMFGAMASLLFLGCLSDRFGFLPMLRTGLILITSAVLLSAVSWNVSSFLTSRLVIGLASGMITTSASLGLAQLSRGDDPQRGAAMTTFAMTMGFGLGPLVGGLVAQWAPAPLVTAYIPTLFMSTLAIYSLYKIRVPSTATTSPSSGAPASFFHWLPRVTLPPFALRRQFWIGCMGAFCAFSMFSLYAALAPTFIKTILPWHGPAISGMSIASILFLSSAFQLAGRYLPGKTCAMAGFAALVVCSLLLILTTYVGHASLFVLSVVATAFGHGLVNLAGMSMVGKVATSGNRSGLLSTYLIVGYLGTILPILALGWLADRLGLATAIVIFLATMAALAASLFWLTGKTSRIPVSSESSAA